MNLYDKSFLHFESALEYEAHEETRASIKTKVQGYKQRAEYLRLAISEEFDRREMSGDDPDGGSDGEPQNSPLPSARASVASSPSVLNIQRLRESSPLVIRALTPHSRFRYSCI